MVLYYLTASREIQWQDFGHFVQRVVAGELVTDFGLALAHPLHFWISTAFMRILPVEPPFAVALVSALFGAIAVANVFGIVRDITNRFLPAALAAAGLAVAHTWWRLSTMPECYTLAAALLTAEVWCVLRWDRTRKSIWLVAMFFANGAGLANHNVALLTGPVIAVVLLSALRNRQAAWRVLPAVVGAWALGG
jgi:dolichyl-phosphate-mannose--protein O-mannosyl transferase